MTWHFLPELLDSGNCPSSPVPAAASSAASCSAGAASVPSKSNRTVGKSCFGGSGTACCPCSPSGMMCKPSMAARGVARWMSSLEASPASRFLRPANRPERTTSATCGRIRSACFAKWSPESRCWKTFRGFFPLTISAKSSEGWRKRGTMRNGLLFRPPSAEPRTCGSGSGFWPTPNSYEDRAEKYRDETSLRHLEEGRQIHLAQADRLSQMFPTPAASDRPRGMVSCENRILAGHQTDLPTMIGLFPTPGRIDSDFVRMKPETAALRKGRRQETLATKMLAGTLPPARFPTPKASRDGVSPETLRMASAGECEMSLDRHVKLFPTPVGYDATPGGPNNHYKGLGNRAKHGKNLEKIGTPTSVQRKRSGAFGKGRTPNPAELAGSIGGLLNPDWVELLMGWPLGWTALGSTESPASRKIARSESSGSRPSATGKSRRRCGRRS